MKIKILQLIDTLEAGGAERMAVNIANELGKRNIDSLLVAAYRGGILSSALHTPAVLHVLNKKRGIDLSAFYKLVKLVYQYAPTHIHAHSTSIVWASLIKCLFPDIKIIWHDHFGLSTSVYNRIYMYWLLPFIHHTIVVKQELLNWLLKLDPEAEATYIPNFASIAIPAVEKNKNTFLCLANMRRQKDFETLIAAVYKVRMTGIPFHLRIVGNTSDTPYLIELQHMITELKLTDTITITGPTNDSGLELARATAGILSSASEGLPVSLLEYGLAGLPVAVTDVGECAEVTDGEKAGLLVPAMNADALAEAMLLLLKNPELAAELGKRLKQRVEQLYGPDTYMNTYRLLIH
ncbi:MAG: glycosyltransferase [Bacteroidota bacterium]